MHGPFFEIFLFRKNRTNKLFPMDQKEAIDQLDKMLAAVQEPPPEEQRAKDRETAQTHLTQGGFAAMASANHLGIGQAGYEYLQAKVHKTAQAVKDGDLSAIEQALVEQFFMLHTMATGYSAAAGKVNPSSRLTSPLVDAAVKCSRASRQLAGAIADMKQPRKTTFIKTQNIEAQQNNLFAEVEAIKHQLEQSHAPKMDTRATPEAAGSSLEVEVMGEVHRPQDT
jgi:hypothetical protein